MSFFISHHAPSHQASSYDGAEFMAISLVLEWWTAKAFFKSFFIDSCSVLYEERGGMLSAFSENENENLALKPTLSPTLNSMASLKMPLNAFPAKQRLSPLCFTCYVRLLACCSTTCFHINIKKNLSSRVPDATLWFKYTKVIVIISAP